MGWTAGADVSTGDLYTSAMHNNYLGATGSLEYLGDKELWVSVSGWFDDSAGTDKPLEYLGAFAVAPSLWANDVAFLNFRCPENFGTLTEAKIVVIPIATQAAADWDTTSAYGASGESYGTHVESNTVSTYNVTANILFEVDVSGILTALAASDYVGLRLYNKNDAHDVDVIGFFMRCAIA